MVPRLAFTITMFDIPVVCEYNINRWITVNTTYPPIYTVKAIYPNTRGTRCLPVRGQTVGEPRVSQRPFFVFFSYTEHGGSIFLRNISKPLQEDGASNPRQYYSSWWRSLQPQILLHILCWQDYGTSCKSWNMKTGPAGVYLYLRLLRRPR